MQGFYVNPEAQFFVVCDDGTENEYVVHAPDDLTDLGVAKVKTKCLVEFKGRTGFYNGYDCITWPSGGKWRRVKMSFVQYRMLTSRRYVPMTFLAVQFVHRMFTALLAASLWKFWS